jgi:hypothetical protein
MDPFTAQVNMFVRLQSVTHAQTLGPCDRAVEQDERDVLDARGESGRLGQPSNVANRRVLVIAGIDRGTARAKSAIRLVCADRPREGCCLSLTCGYASGWIDRCELVAPLPLTTADDDHL